MKTKLIPFFALLAALSLVSCFQGTGSSTSSDSPISLDLASLTVSTGTLDPVFSAKTFDYTVNDSSSASITVTAVPVSTYAGLGISPSQPFTMKSGSNEVLITVTEPMTKGADFSKLKTQRYTVTIINKM